MRRKKKRAQGEMNRKGRKCPHRVNRGTQIRSPMIPVPQAAAEMMYFTGILHTVPALYRKVYNGAQKKIPLPPLWRHFSEVAMPFLLHLLLLLVSLAGIDDTAAGIDNEPWTLTVLHTNDTHGRPLAFSYKETMCGGIPARKTAVDRLRADEPNVLLLDAGDVCDGMPVSNMNQAEPDFIGMGLLQYDAMAVGNHEFSHDVKTILEFRKTAGFPFLCANLVRESDSSCPFDPFVMRKIGGRTVAIFGLITGELERLVFEERLKGLKLLDPLETARDLVPRLREKADHVIALTHCGYGFDKNVLAPGVEGIDLIVGGHSHTLLTRPRRIGDTVVAQAGCHGIYLGKVTLQFTGRKLEKADGGLIPINYEPKNSGNYLMLGPFEVDREVHTRLSPYAEELEELLGRVVGTVEKPDVERRKGWLDRPYSNLVADGMRWSAGADCAIQNTGGVRTTLGPGSVTVGEIITMLPFNNNVMVAPLKGSTLLEALDHSIFVVEERPRTFGALSGLEVLISPRSDKIVSVRVAGEDLDPERTYRVAINSFMFHKGDGYTMFGRDGDVEDLGFKYSDSLIRYLEAKSRVTPTADGRIRVAAE